MVSKKVARAAASEFEPLMVESLGFRAGLFVKEELQVEEVTPVGLVGD